jgi:outer membrane protein OmpA-like peptidoglycan-associated protein
MAMTKTTKTVLVVGTILVLAGVGAYFYFRRKPKPQPQPQPQPNILQDAFDNLNFDFGKATIRESSFSSLDKLAQTLIDAKNWKLDIAGHTDDKGSDEYNLKLSQNRANAVKDYLVKKGVNAETITAQGFGESKPIVPNDNDANRERNRRVEFKITKPNNEVITIKA